ncbi:MAG TPA: MarR family transcriptional regulator [Streptosporangiaceae bacterium]|nr:MarR family transcriptional regulator [Streptosporangiaceae bacterium]
MTTGNQEDREPRATDVDEIVIPALLRAARNSYGNAIRAGLAAAGFDDVPRNGPYVLGGMANRGGSAAGLVRELGVSKQAASQLIDTLVLRGYLVRDVDPQDRRRQTLEVTERGKAAAVTIRTAIEAVDAELAELISAQELAGLRAGLMALISIKERMEDHARSGHSHDPG